MVLAARYDYSFSKFRQEGKIRYWTVVDKIFLDFVVGGQLEIKYDIKLNILFDCNGFPVVGNIIFDTKMKILALF